MLCTIYTEPLVLMIYSHPIDQLLGVVGCNPIFAVFAGANSEFQQFSAAYKLGLLFGCASRSFVYILYTQCIWQSARCDWRYARKAGNCGDGNAKRSEGLLTCCIH